ncbi:hypothetical protein [Jiangella alkaliphila]|uniref:Uncharacterized protein n=1 Tax=Jiangella alkaliphila TaxID=419479 RepID=A0A1H2L6L7_9ACTN|nr:hypothetical protein [Jiangella alkaliphila]SDU76221.1 hypothetical protein SAMN04488563_5134 [Jiangella alkaliphila]
MTENGSRAALGRVVRRVGGEDVLDALVALPGSDLTTLQLDLMRRRAAALTPAAVLERYRRDRFTGPAPVSFRALRRVEDVLLDVLAGRPEPAEVVTLAPLAPLGTHSVLSTVDQNKVVTTVRGTDVAADPTNALALEAAVRRRAAGPGEVVRLAAIQRVVRAQLVGGPAMFAHFSLFAQVTAGRDAGGRQFERTALAEQLAVLTSALPLLGAEEVQVRLTVLDPRLAPVADAVPGAVLDPDRASGHGYYEGLCFKVLARLGGELVEVGDGGFTGWTRDLLSDRKEHLLISGLGIDRLAVSW